MPFHHLKRRKLKLDNLHGKANIHVIQREFLFAVFFSRVRTPCGWWGKATKHKPTHQNQCGRVSPVLSDKRVTNRLCGPEFATKEFAVSGLVLLSFKVRLQAHQPCSRSRQHVRSAKVADPQKSSRCNAW